MAFKDKVGTADAVEAGISTQAVEPRFPCPNCGQESKVHETRGEDGEIVEKRICINRACTPDGRTVFDPEVLLQ